MADNLIYLISDSNRLMFTKHDAHSYFCKLAIANDIEFNQGGYFFCGVPLEQFAPYDEFYWTVKNEADKNLILLLSDRGFKSATPEMFEIEPGVKRIGGFYEE